MLAFTILPKLHTENALHMEMLFVLKLRFQRLFAILQTPSILFLHFVKHPQMQKIQIHLCNPNWTECLSATATDTEVGDTAIPLHTCKIDFSFRINAAQDDAFCINCLFSCLDVTFKQSYCCMKGILLIYHSRVKKMLLIHFLLKGHIWLLCQELFYNFSAKRQL